MNPVPVFTKNNFSFVLIISFLNLLYILLAFFLYKFQDKKNILKGFEKLPYKMYGNIFLYLSIGGLLFANIMILIGYIKSKNFYTMDLFFFSMPFLLYCFFNLISAIDITVTIMLNEKSSNNKSEYKKKYKSTLTKNKIFICVDVLILLFSFFLNQIIYNS